MRTYTIDATPTYYYSAGVPLIFKEFSPDSKVVMMMREPVERLESLYNHWVLQDPNWPSNSADALTDEFLAHMRSNAAADAALRKLKACGSEVLCTAAGWRDPALQALLAHPQYKLYISGLYGYALAGWRAHYFQSDRVMLIDSHTYFRNRTVVMEKVVDFLYGRSLSVVERIWAQQAPPRNAKARPGISLRQASAASKAAAPAATTAAVATAAATASTAAPAPGPSWKLSAAKRDELAKWYAEHLTDGMQEMLRGVGQEGGWVVGFESAPWPWAPPASK
ncbi:hypothetical protein GPECTOR_39g432 [Gonium pectorale]|uniref:Sulfotransferase n=1 Tax=Gonium pectorale TaxID=33097 RepID=A0A150GAU4_GONPE|nr:hypothetical protein GPECTOR_39g432 [Gonium pectorale]|eukprot:KXZ46938.1 hypothetical protein GPECTOR_39g432 [Gonium pectorale]